MMTRIVAGACALALASAFGSSIDGTEPHLGARRHTISVRVAAPIGLGVDEGRASFASSVAGTRIHLIAAWRSDASRVKLGLSFVAQPEN